MRSTRRPRCRTGSGRRGSPRNCAGGRSRTPAGDARQRTSRVQTRLAKLSSAAAALKAGKSIADHAKPPKGAGGQGTHATVNGARWDSETAQSEYRQSDQSLQIYASRHRGDGTQETIYLVVYGVTGPGTYPLSAAGSTGKFQELSPTFQHTGFDRVADSGSVVVTQLTLTGTKRVKATFSCTATHGTAGTRTITGGTHDASGDQVYINP